MDIATKTMDILFRQILPEWILNELAASTAVSEQSWGSKLRNWFNLQAESSLGGLSLNEQLSVFDYSLQRRSELENESGMADLPPFSLLVDYCRSKIRLQEDGPKCRFETVLEWRDGYLRLGQDIFTTALYAYQRNSYRELPPFSWPAVIPSDNPVLTKITENIAENHLHLYAGASCFGISWCTLMNHPEAILQQNEKVQSLEQHLQQHSGRGVISNEWSTAKRILYAAKIRMLLFRYLRNPDDVNIKKEFQKFHRTFILPDYVCGFNGFSNELQGLRLLYGLRFEQPDGSAPVCLDYAFTEALRPEINNDYRLLAGERRFLYECFLHCFRQDFDSYTQWLFYSYLLLKSQFRSELIQVNGQTGFANFKSYDSRKYILWKNMPEYWFEDYRQAINAAFRVQKLSSLEARLSPKETEQNNLDLLFQIDRAKLFYDTDNPAQKTKLLRWRPSATMENLSSDERHYYVLHFPKEVDDSSAQDHRYRHYKYRQDVRQKAIALAQTMSNSVYFSQRVRGIDACSSEIGCRPEVFAPAFRFLRRFPFGEYQRVFLYQARPQLSITYHVGEDFLDIVDGLRAMDEAVWYLDLQRGDRFGHALALGIDPAVHYRKKGGIIHLPKQDFLDNIVWLLCRSAELNVEIPQSLRSKLTDRAGLLFEELYANQTGAPLDFYDYYHSMLLRGDDPKCYESGDYVPFVYSGDDDVVYSRFAANDRSNIQSVLRKYRMNRRIVDLYYLYHYGIQTRKKGVEICSFYITDEYISVVENIQNAMQEYLDDIGICIECNPSSNQLIGTFGEYGCHPILRFNNTGLHDDVHHVQMHVSINSDDPCVFDTSLPFEYTVLASALTAQKDANGKRKYSNREIENYLEHIASMGMQQRFI